MKKNSVKSLLFFLLAAMCILLAACTSSQSFDVAYSASEGGSIQGKVSQSVKLNEHGSIVTAVPDSGYNFIKWSDGVTNAARIETNVKQAISVTAEFERIKSNVHYSAHNGSIEGKASQAVLYGEDAEEVTAVAAEGYVFVEWDDGVKTEKRHDTNITEPLNAAAAFRKGRLFTYQYNWATSRNSEKSVKVFDSAPQHASIATPFRTNYAFNGWYFDSKFTSQATDELGNIIDNEEFLNAESDTLYAKWTGIADYSYPILLVFVTQVQAVLSTNDGVEIEVDYTLSDVERQICEMIPEKMSAYLNDWFFGMVNFEIEAYFTTEVVKSEYFLTATQYDFRQTYYTCANIIPETASLVHDYRSVLTAFSLNDYEYLLQRGGGAAGEKFGNMSIEAFFAGMLLHNEPIEGLLDANHINWLSIMSSYFHELIHTIEYATAGVNPNIAGLHYLPHGISDLIAMQKYLQNLVIVDGKQAGIPYEFWIGEVPVFVVYTRTLSTWPPQGDIILIGDLPDNSVLHSSEDYWVYATIPFGSDITVEAIPHNGFRFVRWSDGVTTAVRHDTNITSRMEIRAIFEPIE